MSVTNPEFGLRLKRSAIVAFSVVTFLLLWHGGSLYFPSQIPSPATAVTTTITLLFEPGPRGFTALDHLFTSLSRVLVILVASLVISVVLGMLMGVSSSVESLVATWIPFWMTVPDVVVILLVMIFLGFEGTSIIAAVIFTATPFGVVNMWEGIQDIDADLVEMADAFGSSNVLRWRYIFVPHLLSYIFASSRYMLGMIWKIVLVGEAFGTPDGIGAVVRFWFNQGEIAPIVAYLVLFVVVMFVIEYLFFKPLEYRLFDWRGDRT